MKTLKLFFAALALFFSAGIPAIALPSVVTVTGANPDSFNGVYTEAGASTNYAGPNSNTLGYDGSEYIIFSSGSSQAAYLSPKMPSADPAGPYTGVNGLGSGTATVTDGAENAAPSVTVGAVTPTTLALSWIAASGGAAPYTYQVLRAPDVSGAPGTFANIGSPTTSTSYTDTGLTSGTKYWYEVTATDSTTPTAQTATSAAVFATTTILPQLVGLVSVAPLPAGDVVTVPGALAGTNTIASASLYAGSSAGGESGTAVQTVSNPAFPLAFAAQLAAAAGAAKFYVVKLTDSAGYTGAVSNEVSVRTSALTPAGHTSSPQTFVAAYGPAFTGLSLGYTFYDSAGAVFARRNAAGVSELAGQGIYSVQPAIDTALLGAGYILWDAPSGTSAYVEPVAAAATSASAYLALTLTHNTSGQLVLTWPTDSAATAYKVLRSVDGGNNYALLATVAAGTLTFATTATPAGATYYYHVVAVH